MILREVKLWSKQRLQRGGLRKAHRSTLQNTGKLKTKLLFFGHFIRYYQISLFDSIK